MIHDTVSSLALPSVSREHLQAHLTAVLPMPEPGTPVLSAEPSGPSPRQRGRPREVAADHLWLGLLWAVFEGLTGYRALARLLATRALGCFAPVSVTSTALRLRLQQAGVAPLQELFAHLGTWLAAALPTPACELAPFATCILALDETKLDTLVRRLPWQRQHRKGDPALLAGKLAALFDIRQQRWLRLQYVSDAWRNCKLEVLDLLAEIPWHSLLLFDLGYFSFPLFDSLTERGYYWISRYRHKTRYELLHVYYRQGVILDALVWLGSAPGPRAGQAVRLVRFGDGRQLRLYLTNVRDPVLLPMDDIARLYARRWDIELAFLTLKELLGLHCWWSSQTALVLQQISVTLILAQVLQALRLQLAHEAGCDPFEVSLPLLVQHLPHLLRARQPPVEWVLTCGHTQGLLRPSRRHQVSAPSIPTEQIHPPPADLQVTRQACYRTYKPRPPHRAYNKDKQNKATTQAPETVHK